MSFLGSAWLIRGMKFERAAHGRAAALHPRDLVDFRPVIEGARYIRSDPRLFATVFVKCGIGLLGANNVLLPILGQRVFPAHFGELDPSRAGVLGMSVLMGARGVGALVGPLVAQQLAGDHHGRLRTGILFGFVLAAAGYIWLGWSQSLLLAALCVVLAHCGSSTNWVFSTTLLQVYTADRFRGRVFAADYGLCMLGISASSYAAGVAIDLGVPVRTFAVGHGVVMLIPAAAWGMTLVAAKQPERNQ